jgi:hypothetical protein
MTVMHCIFGTVFKSLNLHLVMPWPKFDCTRWQLCTSEGDCNTFLELTHVPQDGKWSLIIYKTSIVVIQYLSYRHLF